MAGTPATPRTGGQRRRPPRRRLRQVGGRSARLAFERLDRIGWRLLGERFVARAPQVRPDAAAVQRSAFLPASRRRPQLLPPQSCPPPVHRPTVCGRLASLLLL
uniref:HTH_33 domain-containing protein n=1 Tax=Macrostomum lignano TaxID=282301 RepID=A0A1I8FBZ8_9PLAT